MKILSKVTPKQETVIKVLVMILLLTGLAWVEVTAYNDTTKFITKSLNDFQKEDNSTVEVNFFEQSLN